ncbi:MAG: 6-bladed beta-propeller [Desulfobacteraceae bacterium]|nr:6-bladed beta-propeller [Desulfobacteraceae bacterium]
MTDRNNHRVQVFDADGKFITNWQSYGSEPGRFDRPEAVTADSEGNIYVVDKNNNRIQKFGADGNYITAWNGENTDERTLKNALRN